MSWRSWRPNEGAVPRRTLAHDACVSGVGLHTGSYVSAVCRAGPAGQGIVFRRTDVPDHPTIPARLSEVQSTERRTALGQGETVVQTVEHLLAATAALQIDDLTIDLDGPEPPIGDGSFSPYLNALEAAGVLEQAGDPVIYRVMAPSEISEGDSSYLLAPAKALRLTTTIEWPHPLIGRQTGSYDITAKKFASELAEDRTFG